MVGFHSRNPVSHNARFPGKRMGLEKAPNYRLSYSKGSRFLQPLLGST